jgi:glyoxylase-like metal-dependent hydrolase (beta-lactamase superfamily II)
MASRPLIRETFPVGAFQCNCTILADPETGSCLVIDPGDEPEVVVARLEALRLRPTALVHTHAHFDHVGRSRDVSEETGAGIRLHEADLFLYENLDMQGRFFGYAFDPVLPIEKFLRDGDTVGSDRAQLEVLHTPGHTPGSVCFRCRADGKEIVFAGDTLFQGSVGRTDLWGGDFPALERSIRERLYVLPDDAVVVPGHGPETSIGVEKRENAFVPA